MRRDPPGLATGGGTQRVQERRGLPVGGRSERPQQRLLDAKQLRRRFLCDPELGDTPVAPRSAEAVAERAQTRARGAELLAQHGQRRRMQVGPHGLDLEGHRAQADASAMSDEEQLVQVRSQVGDGPSGERRLSLVAGGMRGRRRQHATSTAAGRGRVPFVGDATPREPGR